MQQGAFHRFTGLGKNLLGGAALCLLALAACDRDGGQSAAPAAEELAARRPAPAFSGKTLDGQSLDLADLKGQVVLVNFWATWCGPCRWEVPELAKLHQSYKDQGFAVVGLSLDSAEDEYVRVEAKKMGADYPIVRVGEAGGQDWGGVSAIPTSFLLDRQGRIVHALQGYTPLDQLADLIRPLLKEPA